MSKTPFSYVLQAFCMVPGNVEERIMDVEGASGDVEEAIPNVEEAPFDAQTPFHCVLQRFCVVPRRVQHWINNGSDVELAKSVADPLSNSCCATAFSYVLQAFYMVPGL